MILHFFVYIYIFKLSNARFNSSEFMYSKIVCWFSFYLAPIPRFLCQMNRRGENNTTFSSPGSMYIHHNNFRSTIHQIRKNQKQFNDDFDIFCLVSQFSFRSMMLNCFYFLRFNYHAFHGWTTCEPRIYMRWLNWKREHKLFFHFRIVFVNSSVYTDLWI